MGIRSLQIAVCAGLFAVITAGCGSRRVGDRPPPGDASLDGGAADGGGRLDAASGRDATASDAAGRLDSGRLDAGNADAGSTRDAGIGTPDAGTSTPDAGTVGMDAGTPPGGGCISGATGTHAVRFAWEGTTSGSTAYVVYETNTLPDTSRWRVSAASMSIGYRPVFRDPFLGEGGLDLSGTVFIDVELSTAGLGTVRNATIAVFGRSFNTTTSGSFTWQTFSGTGASPRGGVSNSAPYEWYPADATAALPAGNDGTLLRLRAGPPSNSLIVRRVEICFDAT